MVGYREIETEDVDESINTASSGCMRWASHSRVVMPTVSIAVVRIKREKVGVFYISVSLP